MFDAVYQSPKLQQYVEPSSTSDLPAQATPLCVYLLPLRLVLVCAFHIAIHPRIRLRPSRTQICGFTPSYHREEASVLLSVPFA
jgi:hypothetical protein